MNLRSKTVCRNMIFSFKLPLVAKWVPIATLVGMLIAACTPPEEPRPVAPLPTATAQMFPTQASATIAPSSPTPVPVVPTAVPRIEVPTPTSNVESTGVPASTTAVPTVDAGSESAVVRERPDNLVDLKDMLGRAATSYAGSSPPRGHNVRLATSKLNEIWVAPGGVFSFNQEIGPTTVDAGFQRGFGINLKDGRVDPVAGGVSQVASTLFQAVYWAGLEIVERWPHIHWDQRYGEPPSGSLGLDATVDDPAIDFKFRNTSGYWIRIEVEAGDSAIAFTIYGLDPGWEVKSAEPVTTNVVIKSEEVDRQEDPELAAGEEIQISRAENGFDLKIVREVIGNDGRVLEDDHLISRYLPARSILLVGIKGETPTPAASPSPTEAPVVPTATPAFDPSSYRLEDGRIRVPDLVGLPEAEAQARITEVGLMTGYVNYQGPDDVPEDKLESVPVGHVLSQTPAPGKILPEGAKVLIAVRKE